MLRRILQNLIANALRYTSHGGVLVGARRRGDRVTVQVCDTGPGIPEAKREAIFQEFQRAHSDMPGQTGFGLGSGHRPPLRPGARPSGAGWPPISGAARAFSVLLPLSAERRHRRSWRRRR